MVGCIPIGAMGRATAQCCGLTISSDGEGRHFRTHVTKALIPGVVAQAIAVLRAAVG